jgi:hypothetical protein
MGDTDRPEWFWELAVAVNAAFKGLLGSMGESGHICARTDAAQGEVPVEQGWPTAVERMVELAAPHLEDGDVLVVADKVVAAALGRIGPGAVLAEPDPKTVPAAELGTVAEHWTSRLGFPVSVQHLLLADEYPAQRCTLGTDDPNLRCAELASAVRERLGREVDCVISDTDTGLDTRTPLIGTLTIGATPIGASAGLNLYEAMRCAVAAEFARGHRRRIAVVVCHPADRRRKRPGIGQQRSYTGFLDADREPGLAHA